MRKATLLLATCLVLSLFACGGKKADYNYAEENCQHVWGLWYDVTPVTCESAGQRVRYCKLCHREEVETIPVADDIALRAHAFEDTVVPPTESTAGYTTRRCTRCGYVVEHADEKPPLYALLTVADKTDTAPVAGLDGVLVTDTNTHVLARGAGMTTAIDAETARRLSLALTVTEEMEKEGATLTPATPVTVTRGALAGRTYRVEQLLAAVVKTGQNDAAEALADVFGESTSAFCARVNVRVAKLGLSATTAVSTAPGGTTTLYDTGVLLARALDTPLLAGFLEATVPDLSQVAGQDPAFYIEGENLLLCGIKTDDGVRFALLAGTGATNAAAGELLS